MEKILYAQPVIDSEIEKLQEICSDFKSKGMTASLKVILVGEDAGSVIYTRNKKKFCEKVGAECEIIKMPEETDEAIFLKKVEELNADESVHGILIQLPLPKRLSHIDTTNLVVPEKDVDGFHYYNVAKLFAGNKGDKELIPCTPKGIITMCNYYGIDLEGKKVVVIGRSLIVGKPMALLMTNYNATVTVAHSRTKNLKELTRDADIIVTAAGTPKKFGSDYFRDDQSQIIFDVGISSMPEGGIAGDCDFHEIKDQVKAITPVPKGVGPMTIFSVTQNLLQALQNRI
jgi:methylenetetrahydrofolate dehydrogenase (NADP+)/methenyltetrahydrofolate cyclohydrolase